MRAELRELLLSADGNIREALPYIGSIDMCVPKARVWFFSRFGYK